MNKNDFTKLTLQDQQDILSKEGTVIVDYSLGSKGFVLYAFSSFFVKVWELQGESRVEVYESTNNANFFPAYYSIAES